jgi:heterodisulfide reductase subunit A
VRICCGEAVKNAIKIKEMRPKAKVFILYRDIRTYELKELYYKQALDLGVQFIPFEPECPPEVTADGDGLRITVFDENLKVPIQLKATTRRCPRPFARIRPPSRLPTYSAAPGP